MKNTYLLFSLMAISITTVAQKKHIAKAVAKPIVITPTDPVLLSYNQKFPENAIAVWSKSAGGNFIAKFDKDGFNHHAEFTTDGKWIRTKTAYSFEQLPEAVQKSIKEKYADAVFAEAHKIMMDNVPAFYKVSLKKDNNGWIVWVNDAGIIRE
jgi:Putative beta-lactamase-inhibitor-like, PepSY-like